MRVSLSVAGCDHDEARRRGWAVGELEGSDGREIGQWSMAQTTDRKRYGVLLILFGSVLTACLTIKPIHYEDDKALAVNQVRRFRALYNEGKFADAYSLLSVRVASEISLKDFVLQMQKLQAENGLFVEGQEVKFEIVPLASAREVRLLYDSKFEKRAFNEGYAILVDGDNAAIDMFAFGLRDSSVWEAQ